MPSLDRKLRFQLFLLHEGRNHYRDYRKLIARMSGADPVAMSEALLADLLAAVGESNEYYRPPLSAR